jgi:hypothetical protein
MNFADFQTAIASRIQDASNALPAVDRDAFITQAVRGRYSKDRPREIVTDVVSDGSADLPLPAGFEDGFSVVRQIEYPIGSIPEEYIENSDWKMYRSPSGLNIRLLATVLQDGEKARVTSTQRHDPGTTGAQATATTVPDADFDAVCDFAASLCAEALQARFSQTGDNTLNADVVNYRTKGQEYQALAKALRLRYENHVGIVESGSGANGGGSTAGAAIAMGSLYGVQGSGVDRLTHRRPR